MRCEYCNNPVPSGATRCPSCGAGITMISEVQQVPTQEQTPPSTTSSFSMNPYLYLDKKSRVVYVVLGIVFGEIGVHNFYPSLPL